MLPSLRHRGSSCLQYTVMHMFDTSEILKYLAS